MLHGVKMVSAKQRSHPSVLGEPTFKSVRERDVDVTMKKLLFLSLLVLLGFACADVGRKKIDKPFVLPSKLKKPLAVRGGAGPLHPTAVAKVATGFALSSHILSWLGPEKSFQSYCKEPITPSPQVLMVWQRSFSIYLSNALMAYFLLFQGTSAKTAIGVGTFPLIADVLRSVLNDDKKKIGLSDVGQLILLLGPLVLTAYACLSDAEYAKTVIKICGAYHLARGLWYLVDPKGATKSWGVTGGDDLHYALVKWVGAALVGYAAGTILYIQDMDMLKAIGCAWIPFTVYDFWTLFIMHEQEKLGTSKSLMGIWLALGIIVVGTLAI